jgi:nucleoside diphosphate kinase
MANANEVTWMQVELSDLNEKSRKLYDAYKEASAKTAEIRRDFEASFLAQAEKAGVVPNGMTIAFGYKFGRLSVAAVPAEKPKAATKNAFRLK